MTAIRNWLKYLGGYTKDPRKSTKRYVLCPAKNRSLQAEVCFESGQKLVIEERYVQ
jgi:hypothetical protein